MNKSPGELIAGVLEEASADDDARATAQALFAAHVAHDGKVTDEGPLRGLNRRGIDCSTNSQSP